MTTPAPDMAILIEWAVHSRPDWEPGRLDGAVIAARNAQWPEAKIAGFVVRMVFDPGATPWELMSATQGARGPVTGARASREVREAAMARMREDLAAAAKARGQERSPAEERARQQVEQARADQEHVEAGAA